MGIVTPLLILIEGAFTPNLFGAVQTDFIIWAGVKTVSESKAD